MFDFLRSGETIKELRERLTEMQNERDSYRDSKESAITKVKDEYERKITKLEFDHELALKKKQFEIDHLESNKVMELQAEVTELKTKLAISDTKLEFMSKITDVNADVLDVKDLVSKLIEKMPTININSIIAGLSGAVKTDSK